MKYKRIFQKKYLKWSDLEKDIELFSTSSTEKGDIFEEFIFCYLKIKKDLYQVREVYRSKDIPMKYLSKYKLEKNDSGVDGLIILNDGRSAAYQVKFRTNRVKPTYSELTKFWSEAEHTDINYTIANCYSLSEIRKKKEKHKQILVNEFDSLDEFFFEQLYLFKNNKNLKAKKRHTPFPFQDLIISDVINGFKEADRGKLIAACGTGKTLTALWITEKMNVSSVLFLAPSLALVKQTLESWADQTKFPFNYLCVCSDKSVSSHVDEDNGDISISDINIPVTTNSDEIIDFLKSNNCQKKYVFSTYQSLKVLADAIKSYAKFNFDIIFFDEAHRTAGTKESELFRMALDDEFISSRKRLFMTATERLVKPAIKESAKEAGREVFSMDDERVYGKVFHKYNFGNAINDNVISKYQILVTGIQKSDYYKLIRENKDLQTTNSSSTENTSAEILYTRMIVSKAIKEYPIYKIISFHSSINNASLFVGNENNVNSLSEIIKKFNPGITDSNLYIGHINGKMPTGDRKKILDDFKDSGYALVSNARCLTEGIDVPIIDCVYFVDSKNSLIDIVQACGRALRKPNNAVDKTAYFLIPILIPDAIDDAEIVNLDAFETVFNVIQALREQDNRLVEWIDELNRNSVKGKAKKYSKSNWNPIKLILPESIDLGLFEQNFYLKIADVNKNPTSYEPKRNYGAMERKSNKKRIFKTLGDYAFKSYIENLVDPTLKKFQKNFSKKLHIKNIKISNNNVTHTKRLGLVICDKNKYYSLTSLGKEYLSNKITNEELFRRQMLRYWTFSDSKKILFPYRSCIKILFEVQSINIFEFIFAIYLLEDSSQLSIQRAISDINYLRKNFSDLSLTNTANQATILNELNSYFGTYYNVTEIWTKKTTVYNQYLYLKNHLLLFKEFIMVDKNGSISLIKDAATKGRNLLSTDNKLEFETNLDLLEANYIE